MRTVFIKRMVGAGLTAVGVAALLLCAKVGPAPDKVIKIFFPNGTSVTAELAVTDAERARGLMFRENVPADQGMLFVFEAEAQHSFWMKNTKVYLDMLWLDGGRRVIHIERQVPPCVTDPCPSYGPQLPARFVLELRGGEADVRGLAVGDRLEFVLPPGLPGR
ncbi:MAG: DUF192 domain-containing protein [Candidatus Aminicenantes bacterium]|nr:DUF192 domain-containing protein [Candidatus Aminicenantes bacterium]